MMVGRRGGRDPNRAPRLTPRAVAKRCGFRSQRLDMSETRRRAETSRRPVRVRGLECGELDSE